MAGTIKEVFGITLAHEPVIVDGALASILSGYTPRAGQPYVYHLTGPGAARVWAHLPSNKLFVDIEIAKALGASRLCDRCERRQHSIRRARAVRS